MMNIKGARIEVRQQSSTSDGADFEVAAQRIEEFTLAERVGEWLDGGTIVLANDDGAFTKGYGERPITSGDRIDLFVEFVEFIPWGASGVSWGESGYSWGNEAHRWTAEVRSTSYVRESESSSFIELECQDFVYASLADAKVHNSFEDASLSGSPGAVLNRILAREVPEVDRSRIEDLGVTGDFSASGVDALEKTIELARRTGALMFADRDALVFRPVEDYDTKWAVDGRRDFGTFTNEVSSDQIMNSVRVDGGTGHRIDKTKEDLDHYTTVSSTSRLMVQVEATKSSIERVELAVDDSGSGESIKVRVQKDDGGAPADPGNEDADVDSGSVPGDFISKTPTTGEWLDVRLGDRDLPQPLVWLIIETDGENGHDVGVDTSGVPVYRTHYSFPVIVEMNNSESVREYGRREGITSRSNISTREEAIDVGQARLDDESIPEMGLSAPATSKRAHNLRPGDVVEFDLPRERVVGPWIVTEREDTYQGSTLDSTISLTEVESILP